MGTGLGSAITENVVVHASSFTKTVCPGVRVGYLVDLLSPSVLGEAKALGVQTKHGLALRICYRDRHHHQAR